jgi:nucleoside-diphosphate-sugar epimerase
MVTISNNAVIIGAGWLGNALANDLIQQNWRVVRSSRAVKSQAGWAQFNLANNICEITSCDAVWFFCIPPGRTKDAQAESQGYLAASLKLAQQQQARRFMFCSSTGVYPLASQYFDETSAISVSSDKQSRLIENEQMVNHSPLASTIVRLGGLFGENRHPGRFLSGKTLSSSAGACVNMIHQTDAVNGLMFLANEEINKLIVNLVSPHHPTKGEFYDAASKLLKMPPPNFKRDNKEERIISSDLIVERGFQFKYTNLFDALLDY